MSQGKAWEKDKVVEVITPYLQLGYSISKACNIARIPHNTVFTWFKDDEELRLKVEALRYEPNVKARKIWIDQINKGDYQAARDWLERREKDDFSLKTINEHTGEDGQPIQFNVISKVPRPDKEESPTEPTKEGEPEKDA